MISTLNRLKRLCPPPARRLALAAAAAGLLLSGISCQNLNRSVVLLPDVPGAKYIGAKECEQCHEEICRSFKTAEHARLVAEGKNALGAGCESCHGPCSLHSESGGDTRPPNSFTSGRPDRRTSGALMAEPAPRSVESVCYQCHLDVRGQFSLMFHHPVPEGRLGCTQCHPPHAGKAYAAGGTALLAQADLCFGCHPAQRGPFPFEHEAMREGCTTCHEVHGSINAKQLTVRDSNLCFKCHFQQVKGGAILIGGSDHTLRLRQGTCWSAGCHEAVHGSRVNPSLRF
jgi:predicted CXXCH cytochrome family protein